MGLRSIQSAAFEEGIKAAAVILESEREFWRKSGDQFADCRADALTYAHHKLSQFLIAYQTEQQALMKD